MARRMAAATVGAAVLIGYLGPIFGQFAATALAHSDSKHLLFRRQGPFLGRRHRPRATDHWAQRATTRINSSAPTATSSSESALP